MVINKIGNLEKRNIKAWLKAKKYSKTSTISIDQIISFAYFLTHKKATKHNAYELLYKHIKSRGGFIKTNRGIGLTNAQFYKSRKWLELRVKVLKTSKVCCLCGRGRKDGIYLQVDHIKPRSKYPQLELVENNMQVLCRDCNLGKGNKYTEDWR